MAMYMLYGRIQIFHNHIHIQHMQIAYTGSILDINPCGYCQSCSWSAEGIFVFVFHAPVHTWEFGLARQARPSRPASARSSSTPRLSSVSTRGIPPAFRDGIIVHSFIPSIAIGPIPSLLCTDSVHCRFSLSMEMSRLMRDGTAEPISRDQISQARTGTGKYSFSLFSWPRAGLATLPGWSILLLYVMTIHTYIHTYIHTTADSPPAQG